MDPAAGMNPSTPVNTAAPAGMDERGPSVPGEVPRAVVPVEGHDAPSPDPRGLHPAPAVGRVIHVGLRIRPLRGRFMDVLGPVRHPEPAVLSGIDPVSRRRWLLLYFGLKHPAVLLGVNPLSRRRLLLRFSLSRGLGLDFLRRRRLFRRSGWILSRCGRPGLNGSLGRRLLGLRLGGSRREQEGE